MKLSEYLQKIPVERDCHDLGCVKSQRCFVFKGMTQFYFSPHQKTIRWDVLAIETLASLLIFENNIVINSRESK